MVEMTAYDLSKGRMRWKMEVKHESSSLS
jgi:translation initiation factor IF-1